MRKYLRIFLTILAPACVFATDGQILINQATVMAGGGFPFTITQPGSYKLTGNLVVSTFVNGIDINADQVTFDMNGFSLIGPCPNFCTSAPRRAVGISSSATQNVTVRNGVVRGFFYGVAVCCGGEIADFGVSRNINGFQVDGFVLNRVWANGNGQTGILASRSTVSDATANQNGIVGIRGAESTIANSTANQNEFGFSIDRSTLIHSTAIANQTGAFGSQSLIGSSTFVANTTADLTLAQGAYSQGNNLCGYGPC